MGRSISSDEVQAQRKVLLIVLAGSQVISRRSARVIPFRTFERIVGYNNDYAFRRQIKPGVPVKTLTLPPRSN